MNLLVPPIGFTYLEDRLIRCTSPFTKYNAQFCLSKKVERVLNYSGKALDSEVLMLFQANGIKIQDVNIDFEEHPPSNANKFQEWLALGVEDIISQYSHAMTLIVGSAETFIDCLVIACWRRVQEWAIVPIISEFRLFTYPDKLFDFEQMIEYFRTDLVDMKTLAPESYIIHENIKEEEIKLIQRCKESDRRKARAKPGEDDNDDDYMANDDEDEDQERIDKILYNLFFNESTDLISEGVTFDPVLSLVYDKDEDD